MIHFTKKQFLYSSVYLALFIYPFSSIEVYAEQATELSDVQVTGKKKKANRKDNEVTGLGKIVKNSDSINREQVLNIRDLVRYDPGIAVVEQGRGGSAGYSIRGVDKNRVAVVVDGIPQAQSYVMQGEHRRARHGGGSINEVENENIASVEISKGASSSEYGSGSLGGAIGFRTKEPSDIISDGKNWGITAKSAYSSKNEQYTNSMAFAGRKNGFEALIQYTDKKGKSTKVHKDAINTVNYKINRVGYYFNEFALKENNRDKPAEQSWFIFENDCLEYPSCEARPISKATNVVTDNFVTNIMSYREFSDKENAQISSMKQVTEVLSSQDYTGNDRVIPDPMKYKTGSLLTKLGYNFNEKHYVGASYEETKQRYDIRDMTYKSYYDENTDFKMSNGIYSQNGSPLDGVRYDSRNNSTTDGNCVNDVKSLKKADGCSYPISLRWSRAQFFDENHKKSRMGLVYRFTGDKKTWVDNLNLIWDKQKIVLDSQIHQPFCAEYPNVDKNCRPTVDKPWSFYSSERNIYSENHNLMKLSLDKIIEFYKTKHHINGVLGYDKFNSILNRPSQDYYDQYSVLIFDNPPNSGNGNKDNPYIYKIVESGIVTTPLCNNNLSAFRDCRTRTIKGSNRFISLSDQININKYIDFGLGVRLDEYKFRSQDPWVSVKDYSTTSWNMGIVIKPTRNISVSYRVSNGFRVPSFQELFGYRTPGLTREESNDIYEASNLSPEKSINKELGLAVRGDFGTVEVSYFINNYDDLITVARKTGTRVVRGTERNYLPQYHNSQSMKIKGINVIGKLDWNGIYDKLPEGVFSTLAYNRVKPTKVSYNSGLTDVSTYAFDALQPARYILGLGYEHPENKWGINSTLTYSKAKNPNELVQVIHNSSGTVNTVSNTKRTTRSWYTIDVVGHITLFKNATLRAGVYNLMNYRYLTWESIRQSTEGSINQHHDVNNYARYAAPGRNFVLSLEAKF